MYLVGVERQLVIEDRARVVATEVPVAVVRHVDERGRVGRRLHLDFELVVGRQRVHRPRRHGARIPLFAVLRDIGQLERRTFGGVDGPGVPHAPCPTLSCRRAGGAACRSAPARTAVPSSVNSALPMRLATRPTIAPKYGQPFRGSRRGVSKPSTTSASRAVRVGHVQLRHDGAVVRDPGDDPVRVGQRVDLHRRVAQLTERCRPRCAALLVAVVHATTANCREEHQGRRAPLDHRHDGPPLARPS